MISRAEQCVVGMKDRLLVGCALRREGEARCQSGTMMKGATLRQQDLDQGGSHNDGAEEESLVCRKIARTT